MKLKKAVLMLAVPLAICTTALPAMDRVEYVDSVVEILRGHVNLLEELASGQRFKYSDNLVRHAAAVERTFGLLGPMEWHAAQAARLYARNNASDEQLDEASFEAMAEASQKSLKDLVRAAYASMEEHDADGMRNAITNMKNSCNACHQLLPPHVYPDIWGSAKQD